MTGLSTAELIAKNSANVKKQSFTYIFSPSSSVFHTAECRMGLSAKEISGCIYYKNSQIQSRKPCRICKPTADMQPVKFVQPVQNKPARKAGTSGVRSEFVKGIKQKDDYPKDWPFLFQEASGSYTNGNFFKSFFRSVDADYADLKYLFRTERAELRYISDYVVEVAVHDDYWRFVKNNGELFLYHNDYRVLPDFSREFFETFHFQKMNKERTFHNIVSYICNYSWDEHVEFLKQKAAEAEKNEEIPQQSDSAVQQYSEDIKKLKLNMLQNYQRVSGRSLIFDTYLFVDIGTEAADGIKKRFFPKTSMVSADIPKTEYRLIYCRVPKIFSRNLIAIIDKLKDSCLDKGKFDYIDVCERNIAQDKYDKRPTAVSADSGLIEFIPPKYILNNSIRLTAK